MAKIHFGEIVSVVFIPNSFKATVWDEDTGNQYELYPDQIGYITIEKGETVISRRARIPDHVLLIEGDHIAFTMRSDGTIHRWVFARDARSVLHAFHRAHIEHDGGMYEPITGELVKVRVVQVNLEDRVGMVLHGNYHYSFRMADKRDRVTIRGSDYWTVPKSRAHAFTGDFILVEIDLERRRVKRWASSNA